MTPEKVLLLQLCITCSVLLVAAACWALSYVLVWKVVEWRDAKKRKNANPPCCECRHHEFDTGCHMCNSPQNELDAVDGDRQGFCSINRDQVRDLYCGIEGRWFEPKDA